MDASNGSAPASVASFEAGATNTEMERVRRRLKAAHDSDRRMVAILAAVLTDGIDAVETACQEAIDQNVCSSSVIINILGAPTSSFLMNSAISRSPRPARYLTVLSWLEGFRFWGGTMAALAFVFSLFFRSDGRASLIGGFVSLLACFLLFNVMAKDHPNRYPEGLSTGHPVTSYPVDIAGPITPRLRKFRLCKGRA
jgi:hypothetical protein